MQMLMGKISNRLQRPNGLFQNHHGLLMVKRSFMPRSILNPDPRYCLIPLLDRIEIMSEEKTNDISEREMEVLRWLKEGKTNWEISMILKISERTVKYHVKNICAKLDAMNRTHAVVIAIDRGILGGNL